MGNYIDIISLYFGTCHRFRCEGDAKCFGCDSVAQGADVGPKGMQQWQTIQCSVGAVSYEQGRVAPSMGRSLSMSYSQLSSAEVALSTVASAERRLAHGVGDSIRRSSIKRSSYEL